MTNKRKPEEKKITYEMKSIKVPIPTFPPTAMVYSVPKSPKPDRKIEQDVEQQNSVDIVSAAIMAKVLEERQKEKAYAKHCDTCTCSKKLNIVCEISHYTIGTQTGDYKTSVCLKCNEVLSDNVQKIVLVKSDSNVKKIPIYPNESSDVGQQANGNNIVKVQPNNFLTDETVNVNDSNIIDAESNNILLNSDKKIGHPEVNFFSVNEGKSRKSPKLGIKLEHHHLCNNKTSPSYEIDLNRENTESDTTSAKNDSSDNLKGPRYCSMRVQTGTKNILLDNAHNNIAPVLYKRHLKLKREETPTPHQETSRTESCSSEDLKKNTTSVNSFNSTQNQQRVADWIQSNLENDVSSSENSQSDHLANKKKPNLLPPEQVKYAKMEENVKRFLFGESEFLKTVEIGKLKYQQYRENEVVEQVDDNSKSNSHTETEI